MRIAVDFDGTIVEQDHPYDDLETALRLKPGAKQALMSLKRAGHQLLLWSARSSPMLLVDPNLNPFVAQGVVRVDMETWRRKLPIHKARQKQMLEFVFSELSGIFDAVDDGRGGKPQVDLFIDDKAVAFRGWPELANTYGAVSLPGFSAAGGARR